MPSFYTVIPLHNVDLDPDGRWGFAGGFALSALPGWMGDQQILERLSAGDRAALEQATHRLVVAYEAEALGTPDPDNENRSIQETKYQHGVLANLALWLSRPSPVRFIIAIHAPQLLEDHPPVVQQTLRVSPLLCHPADKDQRITEADLGLAARLHDALLALREGTSMWTATRALWAGLTIKHGACTICTLLDSAGGTLWSRRSARDHVSFVAASRLLPRKDPARSAGNLYKDQEGLRLPLKNRSRPMAGHGSPETNGRGGESGSSVTGPDTRRH